MKHQNLQNWHKFFDTGDHALLKSILADDVMFHSPVVHTPQEGKQITFMYLAAAGDVLGGDNFRYVREFDMGDKAVLEFETVIDGIHVNGIDMITWNEDGQIIDFKVMVRPLKAINTVHAKMGEMLEALKSRKS